MWVSPHPPVLYGNSCNLILVVGGSGHLLQDFPYFRGHFSEGTDEIFFEHSMVGGSTPPHLPGGGGRPPPMRPSRSAPPHGRVPARAGWLEWTPRGVTNRSLAETQPGVQCVSSPSQCFWRTDLCVYGLVHVAPAQRHRVVVLQDRDLVKSSFFFLMAWSVAGGMHTACLAQSGMLW